MKPKLLVFIDWYLPGYKAGGPVRSLANLVDHLRDKVDLHIVTSDTDYTDPSPYAGVTPDQWTVMPGGEKVWYASRSGVSSATWRKLLAQEAWRTVYINGLYSRWFSVMPLWLLKGSTQHRVVAVRGMLAAGMMKHGTLKKRAFLAAMRLLGCYRGVTFQATNAEEVEDVKRWIGREVTVKLVPNLGRKLAADAPPQRVKQPGELRLVSVARIAVEKNTLFAIECLKHVQGRVTFDLYGPVYDEGYWAKCRAAIAELPPSITVSHKGTVPPEEVPELFAHYHALFMPSQGENFGHTMVEALATGLPLVISDRTPWKDLERMDAGWDIRLDEPGSFARAVQHLVHMDEEALQKLSRGAFVLGRRYLDDPATAQRTLDLLVCG
ncbi:MAG TPA: glycosyltransferase [Flavobacteriales bacterium]|nr:glycosyltransferase [Flavobacteriales bacterium]HMR25993.1 glycosyltransferase [Flavobacteriales bacterium]